MRKLACVLVLLVGCPAHTVEDPFAMSSVGAAAPTDDGGEGGTPISATTGGSQGSGEGDTTAASADGASDGASGEAGGGTGPAVCGDGVRSVGETCDGEDFGEESCVTQGFGGGQLGCNATCSGFSTGGCFICGNKAIEGTEECEGTVPPGMGCSDAGFTDGTLACDTATCLFDTSACTLCGNGLVEGTEACDSADLAGQTCAAFGFTSGALLCSAATCAFDFSGCQGTNLVCSEQFVGNTYPQSISGTTVGEDDDILQSCSDAGADYLVVFVAPVAGLYTFDLIGSSYDTVLSAHSDCSGAELGCNDDFGGNPDCGCCSCSQLDLNLNAGDHIIVAVTGYSGAIGDFTLNIDGP